MKTAMNSPEPQSGHRPGAIISERPVLRISYSQMIKDVFNYMVPKYVETMVYKAIVESFS